MFPYENYCFDTSIVIDWLLGDAELDRKIQEVQEYGGISITVITLCELYKGAYLSQRKEHDLEVIREFTESFKILGLTNEVCKEFGMEFARLEKICKRTQESDLIIASIAKANELIVVTRNKKHFENIDVKIEVW